MTVINISKKDLKFKDNKIVIKNPKIGMLFIGVNWCSHCIQFKPIYQQFSELISNNYTLLYLDGDSAKEILPKLRIDGFPTIFNIHKDGTLEKYMEPRDLFSLTKEFCKRVRNGDICKMTY